MEASDLLREWWAIIRMYTNKPAGPVLQKMLARAGISSKSLNLKTTSLHKPMPIANVKNMSSLLVSAPAAGGAISRREIGLTAVAFLLFTLMILQNIYERNDTISGQLIWDALTNINTEPAAVRRPIIVVLMERWRSTLLLITGMAAAIGALAERNERLNRNRFEEARRQFEQRAEVAGELVHNLRELPVEEEELVIESSANDPEVDPISFTEFSTGDIVAVIKDNKKQMLLVHGLEAWINGTPQLQQNPTHPVTREPFTIEDIKLYRLKVVPKQSGGKKTRRHKKTMKKRRMTRRH